MISVSWPNPCRSHILLSVDILICWNRPFLLRTLIPYEANTKKRLVKTPKVFIRDSGLLHRLLDIDDFNDLLGNPVLGHSWEGFVIENFLTNMPDWKAFFSELLHELNWTWCFKKETSELPLSAKFPQPPNYQKKLQKCS